MKPYSIVLRICDCGTPIIGGTVKQCKACIEADVAHKIANMARYRAKLAEMRAKKASS